MKLRYKLVISAFLLTLFGSLVWSANHYHNQAIEYKKQRDEKAHALTHANDTITDMQQRQRDVAALDEKYTRELADAKAENDRLRADVVAGKRQLQLKATCANRTTSTPGMADAGAAELTADAELNYWRLRDGIETADKMIRGLQEYINTQCRNP